MRTALQTKSDDTTTSTFRELALKATCKTFALGHSCVGGERKIKKWRRGRKNSLESLVFISFFASALRVPGVLKVPEKGRCSQVGKDLSSLKMTLFQMVLDLFLSPSALSNSRSASEKFTLVRCVRFSCDFSITSFHFFLLFPFFPLSLSLFYFSPSSPGIRGYGWY